MEERSSVKKALIEVAAQHPLIDGVKPGEEFSARLVRGKEIFLECRRIGMEVEIYVPGSRHMFDGVADKISLSDSGVRFLVERGLPIEFLHGDDLNIQYKSNAPLHGVYNSADECFVSAQYFKDRNFGQLLSVLSPIQLPRKALHYIWFGVIPQFYTVPTRKAYHNWIDENLVLVPYVLNDDPDWQESSSYQGNRQRQRKDPRFLKR